MTTRTRLLALAISLAGCAALFAAAPAPAADDLHRLIYLGDKGVTVVDLHVTANGKALRATYAAFMDEMFDFLDRDGDGVLTAKEQAGVPPVSMLTGPGFGDRVPPKKGKTPAAPPLNRGAFRETYAAKGVEPFAVSTAANNGGFVFVNPDGTMPGRGGDPKELNGRLFKLLDADGDGKLSAAELKSAPTTLMKLDKDEDELVAVAELRGEGPSTYEGGGGDSLVASSATPVGATADVVVVDPAKPDAALAQRLLSRYGGPKAAALTAKQLGLTPVAFRDLDRDGDGKLDAKELASIGTLPGDAAVEMALGKRKDGQHACRLLRASGVKASVKNGDGGAVLEVGRTTLELTGPRGAGMSFNFDTKSQFVNFFRMADSDNNGYLDRAEAEKNAIFAGIFDVMDRDGDGMLFEKEMLAYVEKTAKFRDTAKAGCRTLRLKDVGQGLFDRIDTDKDGKLSLRELRAMPDLLKSLDGDGDGKLAPDELPRRLQATADEGPTGGGDFGAVAFVAGVGFGGDATAGPERTKGPGWFRKMDRNRDGDVSRAEWLGTEAEFKDADADGDGLISWQEAEAYDKRKREKK